MEQLPPHPPHRWATIVNKNTNGTVNLSSAPDANRTSVAQKAKTKLTESYLPAVMQAVAYYVELIQYEPLYTTTIEPPFSIVPPTLPTKPSYDAVSQPTSTTWKPIATTTNRPVTWWSPPSTEKPQTSTWWSPPSTTAWTTTTEKPTTSSTQRPSTTTPSWWNQQTTPFHKPGYFAPESLSNFNDKPISHNPIGITKPPRKPQFGDLSYLSIASHPYFDYYVHSKTKLFAKKPEYQYLHQLPAELLQDIEAEPFDLPNVSDQENVNEFRRVYDDFYTRTRIYAPITGKKRVPPTRPYVLFLMLYDLYKREAKRLALHEFEVSLSFALLFPFYFLLYPP